MSPSPEPFLTARTPSLTTGTPSSSLTGPTATLAKHGTTTQPFPAMTTHWTPPVSCTWTYNPETMTNGDGALAWLDLIPLAGASTLSCYPNDMFYHGRTGVYSPATCPRGWTTVTWEHNTNKDKSLETTTAICCSSQYTLDGGVCKRQIPTMLAVPISYNHTATTHEIMSSETTVLYGATLAAYTIQALFRQSDKEALGLGDQDDSGENEHHGLALMARVGIGLGVGAFVFLAIAIAIAILFFCRDRRSSERSKRNAQHEMDSVHAQYMADAPEIVYFGPPRINVHRDVGPPPSRYEVATETDSVADTDDGDGQVRGGNDIGTLRLQKAIIQRRIEELEATETDDTHDVTRR